MIKSCLELMFICASTKSYFIELIDSISFHMNKDKYFFMKVDTEIICNILQQIHTIINDQI